MLQFVTVKEGDEQLLHALISLWIPYMREIYAEDKDFCDTEEMLREGAVRRVRAAARQQQMYFELAQNAKGSLVGFLFYALDRGGIRGILPAGYGYIMEVYIAPEHRRCGYATEMFRHMQDVFAEIGVQTMYLTPDSRNGVPFWTAMGFQKSRLLDPDNHMPIYYKSVVKCPCMSRACTSECRDT